MTDQEFAARMLYFAILGREIARDNYASAVANWRRTRDYPKATHGWERGAKMSATYQLKKATRAIDALLTEEV